MTQTDRDIPDGRAAGDLASAGPPAIDVSRRFAAVGLAIVLLAAAGLLAKQVAFYRIASGDATTYYLPLAGQMARGDIDGAQNAIIPPLYPILTGLLGGATGLVDDRLERAGQLISILGTLSTIVLVYCIGREMFSRRVGFVAAALTAFNPWVIHFGANVGPAMLYAAFLAATVLALLRQSRRPAVISAAAVGAAAGLAALTRGEGLFIMPLAAVIMLVAGLAGKFRRAAVVHVLLACGIAVVVCLPRVAWVYERTGLPILDIRVTSHIPHWRGRVAGDLWRPPKMLGHVGPSVPQARRPSADVLKEAQETLLMVIGPATWVMALVWLVGRKGLARNGRGQVIVLAFIAGQLLMTSHVKFDRRYTAAIAGLAQLWGALGLIVLAERCRGLGGRLGEFGKSIARQTVVFALCLAALASWSVFKSNVGVRHAVRRTIGRHILATYGPGRVLLVADAEAAYYANGLYVAIAQEDGPASQFDMAPLQEAVHEFDIDFIVVRPDKDCWQPLLKFIRQRQLHDVVVLKTDGAEPTYLIDARALQRAGRAEPSKEPDSALSDR